MSRTPSTRELLVAVALAGAALALGTTAVLRPTLLEQVPALESALGGLEPRTVVLASILGTLGVAALVGVAGKLRRPPVEPLRSTPATGATDSASRCSRNRSRTGVREQSRERDEQPKDRNEHRSESTTYPVVGEPYDRYVALATTYDDEPRAVRDGARKTLVETLRPVAARTYANTTGRPRDEARRAIETGSWTDDPRAGPFLADERGPSTPLWVWLADLVRPGDPFSRALERTLDELEALEATTEATTKAPGERRVGRHRREGET
ncbi:DUF7269 family protein [Natrarchaeobaculum sulfurireducens]|uniref:Uncharacterized protein n=1 Tax=Natrarchaeobaculum sulfurireducens TaxID=2044521 RepID=A0A346PLQ7_9EURY|nr:hypothetical protein [Natrarchaeobaculum sulfurireducens]AXR76782.1 hypothetical protein AArc1_0438 [Natrarchaeobaculum sulfurireducens]AXR80452.1 hypothetical protein AArcMg_0429 [Natrarchaeobaculum sulfurireducens]